MMQHVCTGMLRMRIPYLFERTFNLNRNLNSVILYTSRKGRHALKVVDIRMNRQISKISCQKFGNIAQN